MIEPIHIPEYYIYDVFHNDDNQLVIISPSESKPLTIQHHNITFDVHICSHKHTYVYVSKYSVDFNLFIDLTINGKRIRTKVNKYPTFKNEIIMSTMVYNEDNYIRQWIIFHNRLGISRFIIYDNSSVDDKKSYKSVEKTSDLKTVLKDFIDDGKVVLINWHYPKRLDISGISGQTTQQCHSIWSFRNSKYIGLMDVDEYINIQNDNNIHSCFETLIKEENIDVDTIGSFRLLNRFFYNPDNLPTDNFNFLKIYTCDDVLKVTSSGQKKHFVIPKNTNTLSIHWITNGSESYESL